VGRLHEAHHAIGAARGQRPAQRDGHLGAAHVTQHGLDLAELHAVALDLHLVVHAPQVQQRAAIRPAHAVARAVEHLGLAGRHHEGLRRALGVLPVARGHLRAGQQQLARLAAWHCGERLVHHDGAHARIRLADGHHPVRALGQRRLAAPAIERAGDGQLGGPVEVLHHRRGRRRRELRDDVGRQRLATEERPAQAGVAVRLQHAQAAHEHARGRHAEPHRELVLLQVLAGEELLLRRGHAHTGAALPRAERVEHAQVEREVERLAELVRLGDGVALHHDVQERRHVAVRHHHALGLAGGAAGEEQIGHVVGRGVSQHVVARRLELGGPQHPMQRERGPQRGQLRHVDHVGHQHQERAREAAEQLGQLGAGRGVHHQGLAARALQHGGAARQRERGVERHVAMPVQSAPSSPAKAVGCR
jgi:hypothetical protein